MTGPHQLLHSLTHAQATAAWAHLWTSTLVLGAAILAAAWRRLTPGAREAVLSLGMAKLLLPGTAVLLALRAAGWDLGPSAPGLAAMAIPARGLATPVAIHPAGPPSELLCLAAALWLGGVVVSVVVRAVRRRGLVRALVPAATPVGAASASAGGRRVAVLRGRGAVPFTFGTWRPVIVLPAAGDLEPAMEASLLAHELAHVRRRDDLRAWLTSLVAALFWFHPLVWIAARRLALAREAACDRASAGEVGLPAYLAALHHVCRGALSHAGLTGWATGALRERIELLMEARHVRFAPPRLVLAVALVATTAAAVASGFAAPLPAAEGGASDYRLEATVAPRGEDLVVSIEVDDPQGTPLSRPGLVIQPGEDATVRTTTDDGRVVSLRVRLDRRGSGSVRCRVEREAEVLFDRTVPIAAPGARSPADAFDPSEPINFSLRDAAIHDVLWTLARMAGLRLELVGDVSDTVTLELAETPWSESLDRVTSDAGLRWQVDGDRLIVSRATP